MLTLPKNVGRHIIFPREVAHFTKVKRNISGATPGIPAPKGLDALVKISPNPEHVPVGTITGFQSGVRSGLFCQEGKMMKIKGCFIERALKEVGPYREARDLSPNSMEPYGGLLLDDAFHEIQATLAYNKMARKEGLPVVMEPVAIIDYDKQFQSQVINKSLEKESSMSMVGLVSKIAGDTRLDEFISHLSNYEDDCSHEELTEYFVQQTGLQLGAVKRLSEQVMVWGLRNTHRGNFVVVESPYGLELGMVDFDDCILVNMKDPWAPGPQAIRRMLDEERTKIETTKYILPYRDIFLKAFNEGYRNPDRRKPIRVDLKKIKEFYELQALPLKYA